MFSKLKLPDGNADKFPKLLKYSKKSFPVLSIYEVSKLPDGNADIAQLLLNESKKYLHTSVQLGQNQS